jgi:hypothetical protein
MQTNENERQYRIIDQLMTAHAVLRDRYARRARILNIGLLSLAIALNGFVFVSDDFLRIIFWNDLARVKAVLGLVSIGLLIFSIVEFRVDWEGQSRSHSEALGRLGRLKAKYREVRSNKAPDRFDELTREYASTMETLPSIPERSFARLKAQHQFKRALSKQISKHPTVPAVLLAIRLRWSGWRHLLREQS